ncbi:MAG: type II toxin-antitoxin system mRNA interferase toxin, RelE/StbE family [Chloroflexi bacterium]|nr:type II toxin-antitoxin system mRNA interferase toxin, RelE/StbE family [Chloroflexota bacterium]
MAQFMIIIFSRAFKKKYKKLPLKDRGRFDERLQLFEKNMFSPALRNHALHGTYSKYRSIDVTGDLRALYETVDNKAVCFIDIDTHHNLYE